MPTDTAALAAFIESAPPGELSNVTTDIQNIVTDDPNVIQSLGPAFQKYHEEQFSTVKLPGASESVIVSSHNSLGDGRYFDVGTATSFEFDPVAQTASGAQSYVLESQHSDLIKSLLKTVQAHVDEHYPSSHFGVYPIENDHRVAIAVVASKYSPSNFWNGRWRSLFLYQPSSGALTGSIQVDVHYYEDGNVRLLTDKAVTASVAADATAAEVTKAIAAAERRYQEDLNRAFGSLSEGAFKALRRQLPVTRQKIEWEKISGYRLGQDIGGGRSR